MRSWGKVTAITILALILLPILLPALTTINAQTQPRPYATTTQNPSDIGASGVYDTVTKTQRIREITINATNVNITAGTIIAPHLWDWYLMNSYIAVPYSYVSEVFGSLPKVYTMQTRVKILAYGISYTAVFIQQGHHEGITSAQSANGYSVQVWFVGAPIVGANVWITNIGTNKWHTITGWINATAPPSNYTTIGIIADNSTFKGASYPYECEVRTNNVYIGGFPPNWLGTLYVSYALLINKQIINYSISHVLPATISNNIALFLDPTFFNGTHYIDPVNASIVGTPYGGVSRVPANKTWLWIVEGAGGSSVFLRFFPVGSVVDFYNASNGELVKHVVVTSDNVSVSLPSGRYDVVARVWLKEVSVNIINAHVGTTDITVTYSGASEVENYPVRVALTSANFTYWSDLSNVYFTDRYGNPIPYYVQELDTVNKVAVFWLNMTLKPGDNYVVMHYGSTNPYSNYNNGHLVFDAFDDWSESVTASGTGPASPTQYTDYWNYTVADNSNDASWSTYINTTRLYMYVKDTVLGDGADTLRVYDTKVVRIPVTMYVTIMVPAYTGSSSVSVEFYNPQDGVYVRASFASWIPGTRIVTYNGTTSVYNQYSWYPPAGAWVTLKLYLNATYLFLYYYNTTLSQWVYVGNVTPNFDPTTESLHACIEVSAWSGQAQSLYSKPILYAYWDDPAISSGISESVGTQGSTRLDIYYPKYYTASIIRYFSTSGYGEPTHTITAYNATHNDLEITENGVYDVWVVLDTYYDPILYAYPDGNHTYYPYDYNLTVTAGIGNETAYPLINQTINYTVAYTNPHKTITQKITIGKTITTTAYVAPNYAIAPHLYNAVLNPGNIDFGNAWNPSSWFSLVAMIKIRNTNVWGQRIIVKDNGLVGWALSFNDPGTRVFRFYIRGTGNVVLDSSILGDVGKTYYLVGMVNASGRYIFSNLSEVAFVADNEIPVSNTNPLCFGTPSTTLGNAVSSGGLAYHEFFFGMVFNSALTQTEMSNIYEKHEVPGTVALFFDPTFYNGTHYFDLINNVVGTPHGTVNRVPTNSPWLWVVSDASNDDYVHLRFFPAGTVVDFYDSAGNLVEEVVVNGTANQAGLVEDFRVSLPAGTYTIKAHIPLKTTLAPHLYDWSFKGNGYILLNDDVFNPSGSFMVASRVKIVDDGVWDAIISKGDYAGWRFFLDTSSSYAVCFGFKNLSGTYYQASESTISFNSWMYVAGWFNGTALFVYLNGSTTYKVIGSATPITTTYPTYIGTTQTGSVSTLRWFLNGLMSYVAYYKQNIVDPSTIESHTLEGTGLVLLDPTFFNGTDYVNLINSSVVGVPYNVTRVPANETWLWAVDWGSVGGVDLRFFPKGSVVEFLDPSTGAVEYSFVVTSDDVEVDVVPGTYVVRVYVGTGDLYAGQLSSDVAGKVYVNFVTPSNDTYVFVSFESFGYWGGLKNLLIKVSSINYTVSVPSMVTKNKPFNYTVVARLTADGHQVARITVNGTLYYTYEETLTYTYSESGHHTFLLYITGSIGAINVSYTFNTTVFVGGSVHWYLNLTPKLVPYPLNYTFHASLDVKYDNGEEVSVPVTVKVIRTDTSAVVYSNTSKPIVYMNLTAVWDLRVEASMTDLDGKTYSFSQIIWATIPHQSFTFVVKGTGYVFQLNTTIKHIFLKQEPSQYNETLVFLDFYNFTIYVYRDYVLVLSQNATNPMYFNVPQGYVVEAYFDMIGNKITLYVHLPNTIQPGTITVINPNPLVTSPPPIALPAPTKNVFGGYGVVGGILSTAMILGVGIGFARSERDPIVGVAVASAVMIPVGLLIGNPTVYQVALVALVIAIGYKVMRWLTA